MAKRRIHLTDEERKAYKREYNRQYVKAWRAAHSEHVKLQRMRRVQAKGVALICFVCGKQFFREKSEIRSEKVCCSKKCANVIRPTRHVPFLDRICLGCGKEFKWKKHGQSKGLYCSQACARKHIPRPTGTDHPNWKGGSRRSWDVVKAGNDCVKEAGECERCGATENLQGHHIKPFSTHPELGADKANIEVLCRSCHALEHPDLQMINDPPILAGEEIACLVCGKLRYVFPKLVATAKYCSWACRRLAMRTLPTITCEFCGKQSRPHHANSGLKYCSQACYWAARRRAKLSQSQET